MNGLKWFEFELNDLELIMLRLYIYCPEIFFPFCWYFKQTMDYKQTG